MHTRHVLVRLVTALALALTLVGVPLTSSATAAAPAWKPRPEQYPNTVVEKDVAIPMSDGVVLRGDVVRPADAAGKAIDRRFPVVVTITAYNKTILGSGGALGGTAPSGLVKRGYVRLTVDARGTGSSEGVWNAFGARENQDGGEIMTWAHSQERPWSNGITGMSGPSYMGISQLWAAAAEPPGLKAIFPQVPGADVYRDVVASGGSLDVGFIPLWLGLVTVTGVIPPAVARTDPRSGISALVQHLAGAGTFTAPLLLNAIAGGEPAFDGPFYAERSVINVIDKVKVPAFFISGEYDLFQRGTPLLFENLNRRQVPTKLVVGPWDHIQASSGQGLEGAGYGSLDDLQLRWFDHYLKGVKDPTLHSDIANLTYYEQGTGRWKRDSRWIGTSLKGSKLKLSATSVTGGEPGGLTSGKVTDGTSSVYPIPVQGLCTRSTNQWTAGILNLIPLPLLGTCTSDNRYNDTLGAVFSTPALKKPITIQGPLNAHLYVSSPGGGGQLSVAVEDEAPDGTVSRLTGGWQVVSHRALDTKKSRYLDDVLVQPYHPFTKAALKKLAPGEVAPIDVEIFPTRATIAAGHKLRISVQSFDVPHLLPSLPELLGTLTVLKIHNSATYPSTINFPSDGPLSPVC